METGAAVQAAPVLSKATLDVYKRQAYCSEVFQGTHRRRHQGCGEDPRVKITNAVRPGFAEADSPPIYRGARRMTPYFSIKNTICRSPLRNYSAFWIASRVLLTSLRGAPIALPGKRTLPYEQRLGLSLIHIWTTSRWRSPSGELRVSMVVTQWKSWEQLSSRLTNMTVCQWCIFCLLYTSASHHTAPTKQDHAPCQAVSSAHQSV